MDFLIKLDTDLFYLVNHGLKNFIFDVIMPIITTTEYWRIPLLAGFLALGIFGGKKGRDTFFLCLITLLLSDGLTNYILKPLFHRPRPFEVLKDVNLLVNAYGYSMPSSHSVNMFSMAMVISYIWRKVWISVLVFTIAFIIGFSRIYVGVHYPFDFLFGILVAGFCAFLGIHTFNIIKNFGRNLFYKKQ
ncbi:MAG: phosphatase PAP2 family protein [Endomicrobiia bacterium]